MILIKRNKKKQARTRVNPYRACFFTFAKTFNNDNLRNNSTRRQSQAIKQAVQQLKQSTLLHSLDMDMGMADRDIHSQDSRNSYAPSFSPLDILLVDSIVYERFE